MNLLSVMLLLGLLMIKSSYGVYISDWYGGGGGSFHTMYGDDENAYITKICVRDGSLIDQITVYFNNGNHAGPYGGNGGSYNCYPSSGTLSENNCITTINLRAGALIDGLQFHTKGGGHSDWYGGQGGAYYTVNKYNECLSSLDVRTGALVDAIQFYFGSGRRSDTIIPPPDDKFYPEPVGPDPIYGIDNKPIIDNHDEFKLSYYYIYLILIGLIIMNCLCLTYYLWNKNKKIINKRYNKVSIFDSEDEHEIKVLNK